MLPIRDVAEIVLNVRDIGLMARFYAEVMGFRRHSAFPDDSPTIIFLEIGSLDQPLGRLHPRMLVLIDPARHAPAKARFGEPEVARSALNHLAFVIDACDFGSSRELLEGRGLTVTPVRFEHIGAKALFFRDPEGNTLELICHDETVNEETRARAAHRLAHPQEEL